MKHIQAGKTRTNHDRIELGPVTAARLPYRSHALFGQLATPTARAANSANTIIPGRL
jgi:hypothetical protein